LCAVVLAAQCTDRRVNMVTPVLFKKYPTPFELAVANIYDVREIIKSINFFSNKSTYLVELSKQLVENFDGVVPRTIEELSTLSGVGRKSASVVLCGAFNIPAMPVDTHVFRVSNRLGISNSKNVVKCEQDIVEDFPKEKWNNMHNYLVLHGRYVCTAKAPQCETCPIKNECDHNI
ncbi:MAG: endonuclease III, partial [Firmicutes bacterium]|nr:endonuclease III [Bacillota bacterium]